MLKINKLTVSNNKNIILENINFDVNAGDVICILGQNGQGKSTLLKALMGFDNVYDIEGKITLNKKDISALGINERSKLGLFLSMQDPVEIHGLKQIDFFRSIFQNRYEKNNILELYKQLDSILKTVELNQDFLNRSVNEGFSGGEKKKNEIAQMLLLNPDIIMLDEIDSGLDFDTKSLIIKILKEQIKNKKVIIFISHQIDMIKALNPNKVFLIANKTIIQTGNLDLANQVLKDGYKKTLAKLGIKEEAKVIDSCIGEHFNEK